MSAPTTPMFSSTGAGAARVGARSGARPWRLLWMLPAAIALIFGLNAGVLLLGLPAPITGARLPDVHGMLLAIGFVATLVSLERATAWGRWPGFFAPALLGIGGVLLLVDAVPLWVGQATLVAGLAAFTALYVPLWRRQYDAALLTQLLAAGLATAAAILWLGGTPMPRLVVWLIAFVVLTIAAERVELARITMGAGASTRLLVHGFGVTGALVIGVAMPRVGAITLGLVLVSLTVWLMRHDVARHTVKARGVTRYMAACILAGYVWLAVAAITLVLAGDPARNLAVYDAVVHAVLLGYTFSMIMAHATTILPAVLAIELPYRAFMWVPVALLHGALVVRLWFGDAFGVLAARQVGGVLGAVALLLFFATALTSAVLARFAERRQS